MQKATFKIVLLFYVTSLLFIGCKEKVVSQNETQKISNSGVTYASGFTIEKKEGYTIITVSSPWKSATQEKKYALIPKKNKRNVSITSTDFDAVIYTPVTRVTVTSTTHLPALEALNELSSLVGFPDTKYISSPAVRTLVTEGAIKELGVNETLNTELTINLQPEVLFGFSIRNENGSYTNLQKSGIAVVYNGDWLETTPLGKAEWIKFFAPFFEKEVEANVIFHEIETAYKASKVLAKKAILTPTVLSGALYKDVWYLPAGESWAAQFIADANANYLYANTKGTGSLSLSIENVLVTGEKAEYWIAPSEFTNYSQLAESNPHYKQFNAYQENKMFTFAKKEGESDGLKYYELGPSRPDLVLQDLIHIFHPELLPNYSPTFFSPLDK